MWGNGVPVIMSHTVKPLGFGGGLHCMYLSLTPFLRCLFRQLLGRQKSGQKLKGNNL
jgi:hypothetical protein